MGQLYAITPFTQLDFPGELACIAWFSGCNLRCVYCHNPDIVLKHGDKDDSELISFLESRKGRLTGVVFSGGEATFCPSLPDLAQRVKGMGFKVKLDTNGTNPDMLRRLVEGRLIDAVALDYKCPPHLAEQVTGAPQFTPLFEQSLAYLIEQHREGKIGLEIRTTCHVGLLHETDLQWMIDDLDARDYRGDYWLQNIESTGENTLGAIASPDRLHDLAQFTLPKNTRLKFRNFPAQRRAS